jgi:hypothetical protein
MMNLGANVRCAHGAPLVILAWADTEIMLDPSALSPSDSWMDAVCLSWIENIPELYATPELLAFLRWDTGSYTDSARRFLFRTVSDLENVALVPDRLVAADCLSLFFGRAKVRIHDFWRPILRERKGGYRLTSQMLGVLRNVRYNLQVKIRTPLHRNDSSTKPMRPITFASTGGWGEIDEEGRKWFNTHYRLTRVWRPDRTCDISQTVSDFNAQLQEPSFIDSVMKRVST